MSMLERNVIRDMVQFGKEMNALSLEDDDDDDDNDVPTKSSSQHHNHHPDDNHNSFFINSSDRSSDKDLLSILSASPDSVLCVPGPGAEATSSSGDGSDNINMRCTMSMVSMARPSPHRKNSVYRPLLCSGTFTPFRKRVAIIIIIPSRDLHRSPSIHHPFDPTADHRRPALLLPPACPVVPA
mmetsp:Transcript_12704/g.24221  ORF Transcript_12704/g.24221 Transcript_12704/m.24221 type:complete len:183 (-) Transcript_12704:697-1245(-)